MKKKKKKPDVVERPEAQKFLSRAEWKLIALLFAVTRIPVLFLPYAAYKFTALRPRVPEAIWHGLTPSPEAYYFLWQKWDAIHYLNIIAKGYGPFASGKLNTAFFPAYPLLCRIVSFVVGSDVLAGLLVSNLAFFGAMALLYKLIRLDYDPAVAERAVLFMAIFPFSLFFSGIYTESLFLLAVLGSFYAARRESWRDVLLWGMLATATRLVGLALVPALLYQYYSGRRFKLNNTDRNIIGVLGIPAGLGLYMVYQYVVFGSFTSFMQSSAEVWGRKLSFPWVSVLNHIDRIASGKGFPVFIYNLAILLLLVFVLVEAFKRRHTAYALFGTAALLLPLMSSTLKAFARYAVVVFPLYLILSLWAADRRVDYLITVLSLLFLGLFLTMMILWGYLG